jgi:protease I
VLRHLHREARLYTWDADLDFADVNPADYVALVLPGEQAPEYIRDDADCTRIVKHFFAADKPVAQLYHAALAFIAAGGVMVPARAWPDHPEWMHEFIHVLRAKPPWVHGRFTIP